MAFRWRAIVARDLILAGHIICRGRFAVSRAANSIDPDQTEPTLVALVAKSISKMFQQKTKQTSFIVISVFSALEILFISKL